VKILHDTGLMLESIPHGERHTKALTLARERADVGLVIPRPA